MPLDKAARSPLPVRIVTGVALGSILLYSFSNSLMSVLVNEVVEGFSLSGASEGMMSSVFSLGSMLALLIAPLLQGRVAKLSVLLGALGLQVVMLALCGWSPIFPLFCLACALLGVGGGLVDTYANSLLVDVHREESTRYLGCLHGLFGVGSLLAPLLVLRLLGWVRWRGVFFSIAALLLAGLAALLLLSRRAQRGEVERATREAPLRPGDLLEYIKRPRNLAVLAAAIFATATQAGILMWVLRYMALRFDAEALGTASISLYWICATINRFSISRLRIRPLRLFVLGAVIAAAALGIGVLSGSAWGMCAAMGVLGLSTGHFMQVLFGECAREYAGRTTFATSAMMVMMGLTRSAVPLLMAYLSSLFSAAAGMMLPAATALGAAVFGLVLLRLDTGVEKEKGAME